MDERSLKRLLTKYKNGAITLSEILVELKALPYRNLGFAKLDTHRTLRSGFPEVVYAPGKTEEQLLKIIAENLKLCPGRLLVTKLIPEKAALVKKRFPKLHYFPEAQILTERLPKPKSKGYVMVISAGTADLPVAREAEITALVLGSRVKTLFDTGVAGLHRLLQFTTEIQRASVSVVVAGMEGALPSVVAGLSGKPVIGVPTSVGYGASFLGLTPLLAMLNACSPNVAVVNINNGFGAGFLAHLINTGGKNKT